MNEQEFRDKVSQIEELVKTTQEQRDQYRQDYKDAREETNQLMREIELLKSAAQASQGLRDMIRRELEDWASIKGLEKGISGGSKLDLTHGDMQVSISHKDPEPIKLDTNGHKGQIMYVLLHDIKEDAGNAQIISAMNEHGWTISPNTLSKRFNDLFNVGLLVKDDGKVRPPKFVKFEVP